MCNRYLVECYHASMHTIHVEVAKSQGVSNGRTIVLVHGSWGSSAMWMLYREALAVAGFRVVLLDLRGHGKSGGDIAGATMADYVADVAQVVSEHAPSSAPVIVGHSMGGLVALMYAAVHGAQAVVAIDPSPSAEVQGPGEERRYPETYTPQDAGMPADSAAVMQALPDVPQEALIQLPGMLGLESGVARSERKRGISVPKENLSMPVLFVGGELGESVPFGIGIKTARAMADYYGKDVVEIKGATHPGILIGTEAQHATEEIIAWLATH